MARKRKTLPPTLQTPLEGGQYSAFIKQLQTQLSDPNLYNFYWSGGRQVRQRLLTLSPNVLRNVVQKVPIISAIINTRIDQVKPFCKYALEEGESGYVFELRAAQDRRDGKAPNWKEVDKLAEFLDQTGFETDELREDDFADYISMLIREVYTIDQIASELQHSVNGKVAAYWLIDGATIFRTTSDKDFARGVRFVQMIEDKVYNEYGADDIIFDYLDKRADIRYRGYGYSRVEQCIDIITTLLFGYNYLRDQMIRDRVPKGFIAVMGDVDKMQMDSIRAYWYAAMSGAGGQWNIPILPSGKDGIGMDFKMLGQNNRDMEYHKLMMFLSAVAGAVWGIDLAEMGIKTDDSQAVIGESAEPRITASKDRGLRGLLAFIEQHINKIVRKLTDKYLFRFVGYKPEDEEKKFQTITARINSTDTINEIRKERGRKELDGDWANMPLHTGAVQIYLADKQREQAEKQQAMMGGGGGGGFGGEPGGEGENAAGEGGKEYLPEGESEESGSEPPPIEKALEDFVKASKRKERIIILE